MLSREDKMVLNFLYECRNHKMLNDKQFEAEEKIYSLMERLTNSLNPKDKKLFNEFTTVVLDTIELTKEKFFEYGMRYSEAENGQIMDELSA